MFRFHPSQGFDSGQGNVRKTHVVLPGAQPPGDGLAVAHTPWSLSPHSSLSLKLLIEHILTQDTPLKSCQNIEIRTTLLSEKIRIWYFRIRTVAVSLQTNRRDGRDLLRTPLVQTGFWMPCFLAARCALRLYVVLGARTELPRNTVVHPLSQPLKEHSRPAKPRYNQFGKCIGGLWPTINLVIAQFCPQATVPIPGTSAADIALTQSQGVCYLASCSDLYSDTKLRSSMPTSQPILVLLPWSVFPSQ